MVESRCGNNKIAARRCDAGNWEVLSKEQCTAGPEISRAQISTLSRIRKKRENADQRGRADSGYAGHCSLAAKAAGVRRGVPMLPNFVIGQWIDEHRS